MVWLWWMGMAWAEEPVAEQVLAQCGYGERATTIGALEAKPRRKAIFDLAKDEVEAERYICAAELTQLALKTTEPKPAQARTLDEMLVATVELAYVRLGRAAMDEGRFDEAEAVFERLAAIGHVRSIKTMQNWPTLNRRSWLYARAREALAKQRPRHAAGLIDQIEEMGGQTNIGPELTWKAVEALRERVDEAIGTDDALAAKEVADGVSCWTTLAGPRTELRQVGGCEAGTSEKLRAKHASDVAKNRERYEKGPVHVNTEHDR
ncbi:MAG: hypothetical protein AAF602_26720 [Myxococcota bacterium]